MSAGATPGPGAVSAEQTGRRVEAVLDRLAGTADPAARDAGEELVRALMDFYGAGLARILALTTAGPPEGPLAALLGDELVAGMLVLHGLHPEDTMTRIARVVDTAPFDVAGFDAATGVLRLRPADGPGCGCAQTAQAARERTQAALACFAPEVTAVELEPSQGAAPEPVLLQIGTRQPAEAP